MSKKSTASAVAAGIREKFKTNNLVTTTITSRNASGTKVILFKMRQEIYLTNWVKNATICKAFLFDAKLIITNSFKVWTGRTPPYRTNPEWVVRLALSTGRLDGLESSAPLPTSIRDDIRIINLADPQSIDQLIDHVDKLANTIMRYYINNIAYLRAAEEKQIKLAQHHLELLDKMECEFKKSN